MINKEKTILAISISTLILLSACANKETTFGEKLLGRGDEVHKIGEEWSEGENLTKEGNELVLSGQKNIDTAGSLISEGKLKINKGEALITKGNLLKANAETDYKKRVEHPVLRQPPYGVEHKLIIDELIALEIPSHKSTKVELFIVNPLKCEDTFHENNCRRLNQNFGSFDLLL